MTSILTVANSLATLRSCFSILNIGATIATSFCSCDDCRCAAAAAAAAAALLLLLLLLLLKSIVYLTLKFSWVHPLFNFRLGHLSRNADGGSLFFVQPFVSFSVWAWCWVGRGIGGGEELGEELRVSGGGGGGRW